VIGYGFAREWRSKTPVIDHTELVRNLTSYQKSASNVANHLKAYHLKHPFICASKYNLSKLSGLIMKPTNITNFPVMKVMCPTCPFREEHVGQVEIVNMVRVRCMTEASQICHHPKLHGKKETHLCRGARDYQLQIFHRMGFLKEPTDACWSETFRSLK
jgi:hypothetical protein